MANKYNKVSFSLVIFGTIGFILLVSYFLILDTCRKTITLSPDDKINKLYIEIFIATPMNSSRNFDNISRNIKGWKK